MRRCLRLVPHHQSERQGQIVDEGERVARRQGDRLGCEIGEHHVLEIRTQFRLLGFREIVPAGETDAVAREVPVEEIPEAAILVLHQRTGPNGDGVELFLRGEAVRRAFLHTGGDGTLQPAHPDHEKLVHVAADDGEEPDPRQERQSRILGQGQHAGVKLEARELHVEELVRSRLFRLQHLVGERRRSQHDHALSLLPHLRNRLIRFPLRAGRRRRPLGEMLGAGRHGERGQGAGVPEQRGADPPPDLARREPLEFGGFGGVAQPSHPAGEPHLEPGPVSARGHHPQEGEPAFGTAERLPEQRPAGFLASPHARGEVEPVIGGQQRQFALVHRQHRGFPAGLDGLCQAVGLGGAQPPFRAVQPAFHHRLEPVALLEQLAQLFHRQPAGPAPADRELLERGRVLVRPGGDGVVQDLELGQGHGPAPRQANGPLRLDFHLGL